MYAFSEFLEAQNKLFVSPKELTRALELGILD
jgi:hypothetical protein